MFGAQSYLSEGRALQALHLTDVALAGGPHNESALRARLAALEALAVEDGGANFQVGGWLRNRIEATRAALKRAEGD